jgi:hypothetical protein
MTVKGLIQLVLLVWFLAVSAAVLIPSYQLLFGRPEAESAGTPPAPPVPPPAPVVAFGSQPEAAKLQQQLESYRQQSVAYAEQVKSYTQEVAAYTQQVAAYKTHAEAQQRSGRASVYELVVKNSLVTLVGTFAASLLTYVVASLGAGLIDNNARLKRGAPPQPFSLL